MLGINFYVSINKKSDVIIYVYLNSNVKSSVANMLKIADNAFLFVVELSLRVSVLVDDMQIQCN